MAKKFTRSMKKEITKQWLDKFPEMEIYKNMWIGNILGPLFVGILLETKEGNDRYYPLMHIDALARELNDCIGLIPPIDVGHDSVSTRSPEDKYLTFVNMLRESAIVPLEGDVEYDILLDKLKYYCMHPKYPVMILNVLMVLMYVAGWAGNVEKRKETCEFVMERGIFLQEDGVFLTDEERLEWYNELVEKTSDCDKLRKRVEENIVDLNIAHLPRRRVLGVE